MIGKRYINTTNGDIYIVEKIGVEYLTLYNITKGRRVIASKRWFEQMARYNEEIKDD